jgi:diguanylate cyclase (GGDEF)-like protein
MGHHAQGGRVQRSDQAGAHAPATTGVLVRRLLGGVVLAVAAFIVTHRVLLAVNGEDLVAIAAGAAAALAAGGLALWRAVAPVVATQADLQVRYEAALADALRDPLTGLGNHRAFHEELDRQVAAALRYGVPLSLLLIDLDEFKSVNDSRGHATGDRVLRGFGELLGVALRRADRAFRIGGDEFAVLLPHTDLDGARIVARRLLTQSLEPTLRIGEGEPVSFSGGVSSIPELGLGPAQLFSQADAALYAAKRGGRTEVLLFEPSMEVHDQSGASISAVAEVIRRRQLHAVYQPIVALPDGRVIGVEGLIRPLPPSPFPNPAQLFAAAEAGGHVTQLDLACIDTIVAGARGLPADQFLTINLAPATLEASEFSSGTLLAILSRHAFEPNRVIIELTEHQPLRNLERARSRIAACRRAGIRFAADDIGAGNAGLRLLSEIEFDILKVDLSLVQRSESKGPSSAVLGSVVELAARTGALVVAEGIERSVQLMPLLRLGITAGQGFYLGRPGPLEQAVEPVTTMMIPTEALAGVAAWRQSIGLPIS